MMDCEFTYNYHDKSHGVITFSEHIAVGVCLSQEFGGRSEQRVSKVEQLLSSLEKQQDNCVELLNWVVEIEQEEVCFKHISLYGNAPELDDPDVNRYLDWELVAKCGKQDVIELLSNWLSFIVEQKG